MANQTLRILHGTFRPVFHEFLKNTGKRATGRKTDLVLGVNISLVAGIGPASQLGSGDVGEGQGPLGWRAPLRLPSDHHCIARQHLREGGGGGERCTKVAFGLKCSYEKKHRFLHHRVCRYR